MKRTVPAWLADLKNQFKKARKSGQCDVAETQNDDTEEENEEEDVSDDPLEEEEEEEDEDEKKKREKRAPSQGVIDYEDSFYENGKPVNFMVRRDGAYKRGEDGKIHKRMGRYALVGIGGDNGRRYLLSNLVCAAFHGLAPTKKHVVDHLEYDDDDEDVNAAWNLEWKTKSADIQASHDNNPDRKQPGEQESRKLDGVYGKRAGEKLIVHYFKNVAEACELHNLDATEVDKCAKGEQEQTGGWEFYYPPETAPEDADMQWEEFKDLLEEPDSTALGRVKKLSTGYGKTPRVSNLGRYQNCRGRRSFGCKDKGYCIARVGGKNYQLHALVMYAFNKDTWNDSYTSVDHINRVKNDNTLGNLQWSDAEKQANNRDEQARGAKFSKEQGHAVEARNPSIGKNEWQHFDSGGKAEAETKVNNVSISMNLKKLKPGEIYTHPKTKWQFRRPQPSAKEIADEAKYQWACAKVHPAAIV